MKVWMDGELRDAGEASISVFDHGLLYGDGVFEGIRMYGGRIFRAEAHLRRLFNSAKALRLTIPFTGEQLVEAMYETLAANDLHDSGYLRVVVTRGVGTLGLDPFTCPNPTVFVIADTVRLYPDDLYANGMHVITAATTRNNANAVSPQVKSLNYLNNILAKIEAIDAGVPEAIMLNQDGLVCEATGDNVFLVRAGGLVTPPVYSGILEGITRQAVMELALSMGLDLTETEVTRYDLYTAEECFLTGTAAEVIAVTNIDGRPIGDGAVGPITAKLTKAFHRLVHDER